jgi:hypothetical protein
MDENALAEKLSSEDGTGDNGADDPGYESEQEAETVANDGDAGQDDPAWIKKRLGMQAKKHQRELRAVNEKLAQMQAMMSNPDNGGSAVFDSHPYPSPGQPMPPGMSEEDKIQHAVRMALGMKEHEERQAEETARQAHVHKQYQRLNDEFDKASEKYDDFDDIVRGDDIPFSPHVRDALLLVENPAEVAYKLGKNKAELERISRLHPLDQAREVNKLSFSLMGGHNGKPASHKSNPMGSIRVNPTSHSGAITDKTPASVIRARMKAGTFK